MKKIKLNGKLSLNKETISKLNDKQMSNLKGGISGWALTCRKTNAKGCESAVLCPAPTDRCLGDDTMIGC